MILQNISATASGGQFQSESQSYISAIEATGDYVEADAQSAIDSLIVDGKVNGWWAAADEVYIFWGHTLNAQKIKLKAGSGLSTTLTTTNFVDADCTDPRLGFGPGDTNTTKYAVTDYVPSAFSRTYQDHTFAVSTFGTIGTGGGNGTILSSIGGASLFKVVVGAQYTGFYSQATTDSIPAISQDGGLINFSLGASGYVRLTDDAAGNTGTYTSVTLDQPYSLFRSSFNSAFDYAQGRIGFVMLGASLTLAQQKAMGAAVRRFEIAVGRRRANRENVAVFGDSITWGQGATTVQTGRWSTIVARNLAMNEVNLGTQGSYLRATGNSKGIDRYADVLLSKPSKIVMMYGTNDAGGAYSSSFKTDYDTILAAWIAAGISPKNIIVCSMPWSTAGARTFANQVQFAEAARASAFTAGATYVDVFGLTRATPAFIGGDTIHPTNSGHAAIAKAITESVQQPIPRQLIGMARGINIGAAINTDQAITMIGSKWIIRKIVVCNASADVSASTCVASIRDAAAGAGNAVVASVGFTGLTAAAKYLDQTLFATAGTDYISASPLYFRIGGTTGGTEDSVDVYIYGDTIEP